MPRILLPTPLRPYADGSATVDVEGSTVGTALGALVERHPALRKHLYDDAGKVRSFVNLYKNDEDVRYLEKDETRLAADDMLSIVPSIAGGAGADLSNEEIRRYSRHLIMPEVGVDGQKKLKAARVLAIGAGGLGSPSPSTSRPPESGRSEWSIPTWWTTRTSSARSSTALPTSAGPSSRPLRSGSAT